MKKHYFLFSFLICGLLAFINAQNPMSIGTLENDTLFVSSGANFLLIPDIDDGESASEQDITITANSSNNAILEVSSVEYTAGNTFAVILAEVKDLTGTVTIDISADDGDAAPITDNFDVEVIAYSKPGVNFEIFDIVFWREQNPFGLSPIFDTILGNADFDTDIFNWDNVPLTVGADCNSPTLCDGHDFSTTLMRGYIVPPISGNYKFTQHNQGDFGMWLSSDDNYDNVQNIIFNGDNQTNLGDSVGPIDLQSADIALVADQVYAFYTVQWNIHYEDLSLSWETSGLPLEIIPGDQLMYVYDPEKPQLTGDIELFIQGVNDLTFSWPTATDNQVLQGYNIYLDGELVNSSLIKEASYTIESLTIDTKYSVGYTAVDDMGNESAISNILTVSTYPADGTPPPVPTNVNMIDSSGLAIKIAWNPVIDGETDIRGYDIILDGEKYNDVIIHDTTIIIKDLSPSTNYTIGIIAIDAGYNESDTSSDYTARTTKFSVGDNLGVQNGKLTIKMNSISWNQGYGINVPDFHKDDKYTPDSDYLNTLAELQPGNIRFTYDWGLAGSCDNYVAPGLITHDSLNYNIGDFMNISNSYDAYSMLTITLQEDGVFVQNGDWVNQLLEYYCGPSSSPMGAERAASGYTDPLIDDSPGLIIEFGNEVWGGNSHCIPLGENYSEYAEWCREMDSIIKTNQYYDPNKIFTCYSGRNPTPATSYGLNQSLYTNDNQTVDWVALSGYMGGNFDYSPAIDPGQSELDYLKNGIELMIGNVNGITNTHEDMLSLAGEIKPIWFYEGNMTTTYYFGRFGQALIYLDYTAECMEMGVVPSLYSLFHNQWRIVNAAEGYKKLPLFQMTAFFNQHCKGHVLETEMESVSTISNSIGNTIDVEPVGSFAYSDDSTMVILLVNRKFEQDAYIQIDIPDTLTFDSNVNAYYFTTDHYSSYETEIDTVSITLSDSMMVRVPAGGLVFIKLKGLTQQLDKKGLATVPGYKTATDVTITCQGGSCEITDDGSTIILEAEVAPADAFVSTVNWELVDNTVGAIYNSFGSNSIIIKASGDCSGNGELTVRASAAGAPTVYDQISISISGQDQPGGCPDPTVIKNEKSDEFIIFPNPAKSKLNINSINTFHSVKILDLSGKVLSEQTMKTNHHSFDISSFANGLYLIEVVFENNIKSVKKIVIE